MIASSALIAGQFSSSLALLSSVKKGAEMASYCRAGSL